MIVARINNTRPKKYMYYTYKYTYISVKIHVYKIKQISLSPPKCKKFSQGPISTTTDNMLLCFIFFLTSDFMLLSIQLFTTIPRLCSGCRQTLLKHLNKTSVVKGWGIQKYYYFYSWRLLNFIKFVPRYRSFRRKLLIPLHCVWLLTAAAVMSSYLSPAHSCYSTISLLFIHAIPPLFSSASSSP